MEATPIVIFMFLLLVGLVVWDYVRLNTSPWAK
jgi:hypothetical protein